MRVLAVALLACGATAAPPELAWKLRPSDFLAYQRRKVTVKGGKETFGAGVVLSVAGHDLRDGQYTPLTAGRGDLPALFALRLPPGGSLTVALKDTIALKCRVKFDVGALDASSVAVGASWTFASRGKDRKQDKFRIRDGKAHVRAVFDPSQGRFASARIEIEYLRIKLDPKPGEKPAQVADVFDIRFQRHRPPGAAGLRREIDAAIDQGVKHLRTLQKEDGDFEPHGNHRIGTTALAILTLTACEVPRTDPAVAKALAWLLRQTPKRTYDRAVCLMALEKAYTPPGELRVAGAKRAPRELPPDRLAWCRKLAVALESSGAAPGSWGYPTSTRLVGPHVDSSNTQYGVLGLRAAVRLGLPVKPGTWEGVVRHFQLHRERKGPRGSVALVREGEAIPVEGDREQGRVPVREVKGFRYKSHQPHAWGSMTCAGIASLRIALHHLEEQGKGARLRKQVETMILGGWAWIETYAAMDRNPRKHGGNWYYYYLYSLERAAILDRVKRIGGRDWYFEGAAQLLARQGKKGGWDEPGKGTTSETCFALLFLKRATAPLTRSR